MAIRVRTLRMGINCIITTKCNVNQSALIGIHGRKRNTLMSTDGTLGGRLSHRGNLILTTALVALNVNHNRIPKAKLAAHQQREHYLKGIKGTTMTTNENSKIRSRNIQNQLALVALVLINRRVGGIEVRKDGTQNGNRNIGNGVELLIGQLFTGLVALCNLRIIARNLRGNLLKHILDDLFRHNVLQKLGT